MCVLWREEFWLDGGNDLVGMAKIIGSPDLLTSRVVRYPAPKLASTNRQFLKQANSEFIPNFD